MRCFSPISPRLLLNCSAAPAKPSSTGSWTTRSQTSGRHSAGRSTANVPTRPSASQRVSTRRRGSGCGPRRSGGQPRSPTWPGRIAHRKLPLVLTMAADSAWGMGQLEEAKEYGREAIALANDERFEPLIWAYADLSQIALFEGDVEGALDLLREGARHPADRRDRFVL